MPLRRALAAQRYDDHLLKLVVPHLLYELVILEVGNVTNVMWSSGARRACRVGIQ